MGLPPQRMAALPFGYVAAVILVFMMLFTTVAVVMRQIFDIPILGVVDIMELSLVALIFIAMPGIFLRDENVTVDVIDQLVVPGVRSILRLFGLILTLVFLFLMMIEMIEPAMDKLNDGEVTMTLGINRFYHWMPIIFGFAASIAGTVWVLWRFLRSGEFSVHAGE